jgi:hypothetical protein
LHSAAERIPVTRDTPTDAFRLAAFQVSRLRLAVVQVASVSLA